jgi:hypothetical protein
MFAEIGAFLKSPQGQIAMRKLMDENKGRQGNTGSSGAGMAYSAPNAAQGTGINGLLSGINAMGGGQQPNRQMTAMPQMNPYIQSLLSM